MDISKEHSVEVVKIQEGTACLRWRGIWGISILTIYSAWVDSLLTYGSQVVVVTTLRQLERVQILWLSGNRCWLTDITTALQRLNYPIHATLEELCNTDFVTMLSSRCGRPRSVDDPTTSVLVQVFSRSVPILPRHSYYGTPYCDDPGFDLNSTVLIASSNEVEDVRYVLFVCTYQPSLLPRPFSGNGILVAEGSSDHPLVETDVFVASAARFSDEI